MKAGVSHQNSDAASLVTKEAAIARVSGREAFNLIGCFLPTSSSYQALHLKMGKREPKMLSSLDFWLGDDSAIE